MSSRGGGLVALRLRKSALRITGRIIRNFIARTSGISGSVFSLWDSGDQDNCWSATSLPVGPPVSFVAPVRVQRVRSLRAWSYFEQFNARNRVRSDPECREALDSPLFSFTDEEMARGRVLAQNPPRWRRPRPEDAAKGLQLGMLYRFGHDFASTLVHPMANDGLRDFFQITKLKPSPEFPRSALRVVSNT